MGRKVPILTFLFIFLFAAGTGIRFAGNQSLFSAEMVYRPARKMEIPGTKTAEDTAVSFYMYIDRGMYEEAYKLSLEPDFTPGSGPAGFKEEVTAGPARPAGITGKEEFIDRLQFELGRYGSWIQLHNIKGTAGAENITAPAWFTETGGDGNGSCIPVHVTGHLLGACTIFSWEKSVPVIETPDGFKVLLPGTKGERRFYYQNWIMNIVKLFDLRATDQTGVPEGR